MNSVSSNAVARKNSEIEHKINKAVQYIGNAPGMSLTEIFNTYSKQNSAIYKGYLDWSDNRCPLYGQNADTVEITCYNWNLIAQSIKGKFYTFSDGNWVAVQ